MTKEAREEHHRPERYTDAFDKVHRAKNQIHWVFRRGDLMYQSKPLSRSVTLVQKISVTGVRKGSVRIVVSRNNDADTKFSQYSEDHSENNDMQVTDLDYDLATLEDDHDLLARVMQRSEGYYRIVLHLDIKLSQNERVVFGIIAAVVIVIWTSIWLWFQRETWRDPSGLNRDSINYKPVVAVDVSDIEMGLRADDGHSGTTIAGPAGADGSSDPAITLRRVNDKDFRKPSKKVTGEDVEAVTDLLIEMCKCDLDLWSSGSTRVNQARRKKLVKEQSDIIWTEVQKLIGEWEGVENGPTWKRDERRLLDSIVKILEEIGPDRHSENTSSRRAQPVSARRAQLATAPQAQPLPVHQGRRVPTPQAQDIPTHQARLFPCIKPSLSPRNKLSLSPRIKPNLIPCIKPSLFPRIKPNLFGRSKPNLIPCFKSRLFPLLGTNILPFTTPGLFPIIKTRFLLPMKRNPIPFTKPSTCQHVGPKLLP
ncbi:unnamed protein product [Parascedosporium putredinis]|uniref:Uncharacterized protein n=1 Tax=Parascedosporium putredinis TaxID=1442378 RepID=A0A9P1M7K6_9PEZI|nr:unnamed protein product [Parascedosporium putredinis]CAI7991857.1 unnamed protein product [Parascedosporium putredinis]